jgi:hypothetical protein
MRNHTWLLLLLILGCAPTPTDHAANANTLFDREQALKNLEAQANEAGQAVIQEDHAKMAELTLPALVEALGGRAKYIKKLESIATEMKGKGFRPKRVNVKDPSPLVQGGGEFYAVVPSELELSGPGGATGRQSFYMVAVSKDQGATWKFIDGAGVGGDRGKLKKLLPNFPDGLTLPDAQPPIWDKQAIRSPGPTKTLARPGFTFDHPAAWTVNDQMKSYDPDHLFQIRASIGAYIFFAIADKDLDVAKTLANHVEPHSKRMTNPVQTEFDRWGKYNGSGVVLRGTFLFLVPTTIRVFVFSEGGKTITVVEYCPDDEKEQLDPGYQTIENSFRVLQERKANVPDK